MRRDRGRINGKRRNYRVAKEGELLLFVPDYPPEISIRPAIARVDGESGGREFDFNGPIYVLGRELIIGGMKVSEVSYAKENEYLGSYWGYTRMRMRHWYLGKSEVLRYLRTHQSVKHHLRWVRQLPAIDISYDSYYNRTDSRKLPRPERLLFFREGFKL